MTPLVRQYHSDITDTDLDVYNIKNSTIYPQCYPHLHR